MQNPTELTALLNFSEWKENCEITGQPFCNLPNPCPTTSRELPGETIRLHTCMECPNNYPWILDPSGDGFSFKWLKKLPHPLLTIMEPLLIISCTFLRLLLKIIMIKNKPNAVNTFFFLLAPSIFQMFKDFILIFPMFDSLIEAMCTSKERFLYVLFLQFAGHSMDAKPRWNFCPLKFFGMEGKLFT